MFSCIGKHLVKGGIFVADVFNPNPVYRVRDGKELLPIGSYSDPYDGKNILVNEQYSYDKGSQSTNVIWHYKKGKKLVYSKKLKPMAGAVSKRYAHQTANMRCFFPLEFDNLFHYNGFRIVCKYGSFKRTKFNSESQHQIVVSKAR